jgi:hypothetical protein
MASNLPRVESTISDPGLSLTRAANKIPVFIGYCSGSAAANSVHSISRLSGFASANLGDGTAVQEAALALLVAGGPVIVVKSAASVAGANGAVTRVGAVGPAVSLTGTPILDLDVIIEVTTTGALGAARFRYSLDGGNTYSPVLTVPTGGVYAIPGTGITATFAAGSPTAGETYSWSSTAPMLNAADLAAAIAALRAKPQIKYRAIRICGRPASSSAGNTLFAGASTQMTSLSAAHRYARLMMDAGIESSPATVLTSFAAAADKRILVKFGWDRCASALPFTGYGFPRFGGGAVHMARATLAQFSENLGRVLSGPLVGVIATEFDEGENELLSIGRIETTRTYPDAENVGYYATEGLLMSPAGSDFDTWERGIVMDVACEAVVGVLTKHINENFSTVAGGKIDPGEAKELGDKCDRAVKQLLVNTRRANGKAKQIDAVKTTIDTENDFLSTQEILGDVAIRPLGRGRVIKFRFGYTDGAVTIEELAA